MLASTAGIMSSTSAEARPGVYGQGPGGGFSIHTPRKRCTRKNPCSRMPELPFFPDGIQPMPRGGRRR